MGNAMKEIRFHGRGGQGVVIGSELLADAAVREGRYGQSFPTFGPERKGSPVMAFTRIDDKPIRLRCQIYEPDYVIVLDQSVCRFQDVANGLKARGVVILNTPYKSENVKKELITKGQIYTIDATNIAIRNLGSPVVNTAILGAFVAITGEVKLESICDAITDRFPNHVAKKNIQAVKEAYEEMTRERFYV